MLKNFSFCGNVDNSVISSNLKITAPSLEEIPLLMMSKSQFPRSWLRLKYCLVPNASHSWGQLSFSGRTLRTLGAQITNVVHIQSIRGLNFVALKSGTSCGYELTSKKGERHIFFSYYSIILVPQRCC